MLFGAQVLRSSAFRARSLAHLVAENSTRPLVRRQLSHAKTFGTGAASQRANTDKPYSQAFNYCRLSQAQWTIHPDTVECEPYRSGSSFLPQTLSTGARQRDAMRHSGPSAIPTDQHHGFSSSIDQQASHINEKKVTCQIAINVLPSSATRSRKPVS